MRFNYILTQNCFKIINAGNLLLLVFLGHGLEPGEPEVGRVLVALGDPVHQVHVHLRIVDVLLHLHRVRQDHVQVEHQILHLLK